jgi:peptidoglycan/xylan/chitin deacetylase (PgdA/CDA1 family)
MLKNGWYILNYHDISWEENPFIRGIGGSFPPDIFREHLEVLSQHGKLVSVQEGFKRWQQGRLDEPLASFWFDDGFAGVRRYAMPIMDSFGVKGAISINSRFTLRKEMFWRAKLSYLSQTDGLRFLRSRLKPFGYTLNQPIKAFTMDHFSLKLIKVIDAIYEEFVPEHVRSDAFRIFDTMEGIGILHKNGWEIANHSSAHYPLGEAGHIEHFAEEFTECEEALRTHLDLETRFWVLPFDRKSLPLGELLKVFHNADTRERHLVLVGNRTNTNDDPHQKVIFRIDPPYLNGEELARYLKSIPCDAGERP